MVDTNSNSAQTMGFMDLDPNNDRGHQIDVVLEKGQEYQAVRIFGKDKHRPDLLELFYPAPVCQ